MSQPFDELTSMFAGVTYFHGRLSAQQANFRLNRRGCLDGLFLIYEDIEIPGKYILAICSDDKVRNYYLGLSADGRVTYGNGVTAQLMHPDELIHYHLQKCKNFSTRPLVPCLREMENTMQSMAWQSVTMKELETQILHDASSLVPTKNYEEALRSQRRVSLLAVAGKLHIHQPWFHGLIDRDEAEQRLSMTSPSKSGTFLIREKADNKTFVLSIHYKNSFRHYTIQLLKTDDGDLFCLDDEPPFHNLMDLVEHYSIKPKSFVLALMSPCRRPGFQKQELPRLGIAADEALKNYVKETQHLLKREEEMIRTFQVPVETVNKVLLTSGEREKLDLSANAIKNRSNFRENVKDEDDMKLEEVLSAALSLNNDLLVTKIDI